MAVTPADTGDIPVVIAEWALLPDSKVGASVGASPDG